MVILKAIGAFFVKIWRWIKETAWVQPLLIVGAIFAIIFSIPYFTQWVQSLQGEASGSFFASYQVSLEGEVIRENGESKLTNADKLTQSMFKMNKVCQEWNSKTPEEFNEAEAKKAINTELNKAGNKEWGKKYFLVYTGDDCAHCAEAENGFRELSNQWATLLDDHDELPLVFHSINTSEKSSNDSKFTKKREDTAFYRYLTNWSEFFNTVGPELKDTYYYTNAKPTESNYEVFSEPGYESFVAPSILLIDYSDEAIKSQRAGVSEIVFGVQGSTSIEKGEFLLTMWNHCKNDPTSKFSSTYNS